MPFMDVVKPITQLTWLYKCYKCDRTAYSSFDNNVYCYCDVKNRMRLSRCNSI